MMMMMMILMIMLLMMMMSLNKRIFMIYFIIIVIYVLFMIIFNLSISGPCVSIIETIGWYNVAAAWSNQLITTVADLRGRG